MFVTEKNGLLILIWSENLTRALAVYKQWGPVDTVIVKATVISSMQLSIAAHYPGKEDDRIRKAMLSGIHE